ncbi:DUF1697 domain-containing protein [Deinococcus sp. KNUC1210]|uniref:DUF1697 domain-containing protein n=1 Tax=Deinococcus sp. KNUC1210 TaxID=2917691 RepID=UPI001EF05C06|nr:DUF1697 domain-containing protein [Deinococcus sp. KNUC1210]ULH14579.1 DUF1697 domain-containing protein [Deinococcus sp. KNUC1210]
MTTVALLRGINVGGHHPVPMAALKSVFESLGLTHVQTYIQSGNVVFEGDIGRPALEAALLQAFGFPVAVLLRSAAQWQDIIGRNPYPLQAEADGSKVHLTLLDALPTSAGLAAFGAVPSGADEWTHSGLELYLHTPDGMGRTKLNPDRLKVKTTTRNWRTVLRLGELVSGQG